MKKLILAFSLCIALSTLVVAGPTISVVLPVYDFGSVLEGIAVAHTFVIENTGDEALEISDVRAQCGCTLPEWRTASIEPGESVALDVLVNTTGFSGTQSKLITVYSNDPETPLLSLRVMGQVLKSEPFHIAVSDAYYGLYRLIDLRPAEEFEAHHFFGAVSMPLENLVELVGDLPHETFIILYDVDGSTVDSAALELADEGYTFVVTLVGGINEWVYLYDMKNIVSNSEMFTLPPRTESHTANPPSSKILPIIFDGLFYLSIDVRSEADYAESHILGSINIPFDELESWSDSLPSGVLLITYDQNGFIADQAALWLINNDFSRAKSMLGGLDEWIRQYGQDYLLPSSP